MIGDTGCCGSNFKRDGTTFFGLMSLSLPMIILCGIILPFFSIASNIHPYIKKIRGQVIIILRANFRLIHATVLIPKLRCRFAGKVFSYSPKLAGVFYRYFNMLLLVLSWSVVTFCVYLIMLLRSN